MSKSRTPGPWRLSLVEDGGIRHLVPIDATGTSLLTVVHEGGYDGGETTPFGAVYTDEDARLIVAAPELLEALQMWLAIHDSPAGFAGKVGRDLDAAIAAQQVKVDAAASAARAAIAKATGQVA